MCTKTGKPTATAPVFVMPSAGSATTAAVRRRHRLATSMGSGTAHSRRWTAHTLRRCAILTLSGGHAATVNRTEALCDGTSRRRRRRHRLELPQRRCKEPIMPYWIYNDKVTPTAKLHHDWCGACKYGRGMHGHQKPDENE